MTRFPRQIALVFLAIFAFCALAPLPVLAQTGLGGGNTPAKTAAPYIPLEGPGQKYYLLTPSGGNAKAGGACIFDAYPTLFDEWKNPDVKYNTAAFTSTITDQKEKDLYETMSATANITVDKDPDGCPYILNEGAAVYLQSCSNFYQQIPVLADDKGNFNDSILSCCHLPPDASRIACQNANKQKTMQLKAFRVITGKKLCVATEGMSKEEYEKCTKEKQAKMSTIQQCAMNSFMRIGAKFNAGKIKSCIDSVKKYIKRYTMKTLKEHGFETGDSLITTMSDINVIGGVAAGGNFVSKPIGAAGKGVKAALRYIGIAVEIGNTVNDLLNSCTNINTGFVDLQSWAKQTLDNVVCQGIIQLIERQLTQCIRINISGTTLFSLPNFNVVTQCPININLNMRIGKSGFLCGSFVNFQSPVAGTTIGNSSSGGLYGGHSYSLLGPNGGLRKLFSNACFRESVARSQSGAPMTGRPVGNGQGGFVMGGTNEAPFMPGIDCVKEAWTDGSHKGLNPLITNAFSGTQYLPTGPAPTNPDKTGWSISPKKDIFNVAGLQNPITVSRCDYFKRGRSTRTEYVFGDGSECNDGTSAFKTSDLYEARTVCYPNGGYLPKTLGDIPIACMYPQEMPLFGADGKFNSNITQKCLKQDLSDLDPAKANNPECQPEFSIYAHMVDANGVKVPAKGDDGEPLKRWYPKASGGLSVTPKGPDDYSQCKDFDLTSDDVSCCDPQFQDCRKMPRSMPICACDEGDKNNAVVLGTDGKPTGACKAGGGPTCCNQALNGKGGAGCGTEYYDWTKDANGKEVATVQQPEGTKGEILRRGRVNTPTMMNCKIAQQTCIVKDKDPNGVANGTAPPGLSPFAYLKVRPDVDFVDGAGVQRQCCSSPWCNICPQQYAGAWSLAKAGAFIAGGGSNVWVWGAGQDNPPPIPAGGVSYKAQNDAENWQMFRLGWPYFERFDPQTNKRTFTLGLHAWHDIWRAVYADRKKDHEDDPWYNTYPRMFAWKWFHGMFDYQPVAKNVNDPAPTAWNEYGYWSGSTRIDPVTKKAFGIAKPVTFSMAKSLKTPPIEYPFRVDNTPQHNKIMMNCDVDALAVNSYNDFVGYWKSRADRAWLTTSKCPEDGGSAPYTFTDEIEKNTKGKLIGIGGVTFRSQNDGLIRPCPTYGAIWNSMKLRTWKQDATLMQDGAMGLVEPEDDEMMSFKLYGSVPEPAQYPIDYVNLEMAQIAKASGNDYEAIDLCDNVIKFCPDPNLDSGSGGLDPNAPNPGGLPNGDGGFGDNGVRVITPGDIGNPGDSDSTRSGNTRNVNVGNITNIGSVGLVGDPLDTGGNGTDGDGTNGNGTNGNGSGKKRRTGTVGEGDGGLIVGGDLTGGIKPPKTGGGGGPTDVPSLTEESASGSIFDKLF